MYDLACSYLHNLFLTIVHLPHCNLHGSCVLLNVLPPRSCVAHHALAYSMPWLKCHLLRRFSPYATQSQVALLCHTYPFLLSCFTTSTALIFTIYQFIYYFLLFDLDLGLIMINSSYIARLQR